MNATYVSAPPWQPVDVMVVSCITLYCIMWHMMDTIVPIVPLVPVVPLVRDLVCLACSVLHGALSSCLRGAAASCGHSSWNSAAAQQHNTRDLAAAQQ